ncbi:MAG: DUF3014 domain-containing protein [Gammaproteobacteria bacterium]|nr:DUF3014 domain-containing protein [Gammaproteobacteria bacterium]
MKSFSYIVFILLLAGAGAYYYFQLDKAREQETRAIPTAPLQVPEDETPEILHPVPESLVMMGDATEETQAETEPEEPLPPLMESDDRIREIISGMFDNDLVKQMVQQTGLIHRFVLTIDSLPSDKVPIKYRLFPTTSGKFLVQTDASDKILVDPENFARYDAYMQLLDKLDTEQFAKWYTRYYPLIQEEYDALGYKSRYFNDRFISVIDHLLETPDLTGPIELVQPNVFYNFADPALQELSAGQKILLRIGPANRKRVQAKLIEIRKALASPQ